MGCGLSYCLKRYLNRRRDKGQASTKWMNDEKEQPNFCLEESLPYRPFIRRVTEEVFDYLDDGEDLPILGDASDVHQAIHRQATKRLFGTSPCTQELRDEPDVFDGTPTHLWTILPAQEPARSYRRQRPEIKQSKIPVVGRYRVVVQDDHSD